jgi:hypothetical protein
MYKESLMLPPNVTGADPALVRIGLRYLANREQFIKLVAALPMVPAQKAPDVVVVDDAGDLLSQAGPQFKRERAIFSSMPFINKAVNTVEASQSMIYMWFHQCFVPDRTRGFIVL